MDLSQPETLAASRMVAAAVGVLFIGLSKAGFGGGLGMLTTPLCVLAFGPHAAIGILLPLLCAGDALSLRYYWRRWETRNLRLLLPGIVVGVLIGVQLLGKASPRQLNLVIGCLAVLFVGFQWARALQLGEKARPFKPGYTSGTLCGVTAGLTSSFAHGAGPVVAVYLLAQKLPKEVFVGTTALVFTWINWIKMPFFVAGGLVNLDTLRTGLMLLPLVPLGVWIGVWLNRRVPELLFVRLVHVLTLLAGLQLVFQFDLLWFLPGR